MDRLDFTLLSRLMRDPRASYDALGNVVGLTGNAVKARIRRMETDGVLQGFSATPSPAALGLREGLLVFTSVDDLAEREDDLLRNLPDVSGVRYVDVTHDHSVVLWLLYRDDEDWERIERASVSLVGKPPSWDLRLPSPSVDVNLTPTDWKIARAMLADGRMPLKDVVRRSNVSSKTVKRRLDALLADATLRIEPVLSPSEAEGLVLYTLLVVLREDAHPRDLASLLPEATFVSPASSSRLVVVHGHSANLRAAQADHRTVRASPHIERVVFEIATRRRADHWLEEAATARIMGRVPANAARVPVPIPRASRHE